MLVWIDLETTGLDEQRDVILEIATLITDDNLNLVAEGPDLILHASEDELGLMGEYVQAMHANSGLTQRCRESSVTLEEATRQTLEFVQQSVPEARTAPLGGNSILLDRSFLKVHMSELNEYLHYRSIDVSTIKELARRWNPRAFAGAPKKQAGHRAMDDIRESLQELQYYRTAVFQQERPSLSTSLESEL